MINSVASGTPELFSDSTTPKPAAEKTTVNKETFLQLLVAQIRNQNPLNPADGVQFLTQLAQFSELEQMMGIRTEIAGLREQLTPKETMESQNKETSGAENV
jgi:flagellar basal-body rod modification protein FlgD